MKTRIIAAALAAFFILPMFSITALAAPEDDIIAIDDDNIMETEILAPEDAPDVPVTDYPDKYVPRPFAPSGTGSVIDNATDGDGKEFYTIKTPDDNVFYLIIDRQRNTDNVYFLNAVTEADLLSLAKIPDRPAQVVTEQPVIPTSPEQETPPAPEQDSGGNMGMLILVIAVIVIGGGAGWYFKIYKPKQDKLSVEDDYISDEPDIYGGDVQDADQDDSTPWYENEDEQNGGNGEDE